jgi:D-amino-acid oxidase
LGVKFRRLTVSHIREAFTAGNSLTEDKSYLADVVVNCTGLLASRLGGVMDSKMIPTRGQLVIVENESNGQYSISGDSKMVKEIGESCYIIDRPAGRTSQNSE